MQWVNTGNSTLTVRHHMPLSGADPGGVDWVASHPRLEQPTKKL